jgi:hypothetical protein
MSPRDPGRSLGTGNSENAPLIHTGNVEANPLVLYALHAGLAGATVPARDQYEQLPRNTATLMAVESPHQVGRHSGIDS